MFSLKEQFIKDFENLTERFPIVHRFSDFGEWIDEIQSRFASNKRTVFLEWGTNEDDYDFKITLLTEKTDGYTYKVFEVSELKLDDFVIVVTDYFYQIDRVNNLNREQLKTYLYEVVSNHLRSQKK